PEAEPLDDVRERAQAERQLLVRGRVERLRPQPEPARGRELLDVRLVADSVILAEARQPPGRFHVAPLATERRRGEPSAAARNASRCASPQARQVKRRTCSSPRATSDSRLANARSSP